MLVINDTQKITLNDYSTLFLTFHTDEKGEKQVSARVFTPKGLWRLGTRYCFEIDQWENDITGAVYSIILLGQLTGHKLWQVDHIQPSIRKVLKDVKQRYMNKPPFISRHDQVCLQAIINEYKRFDAEQANGKA